MTCGFACKDASSRICVCSCSGLYHGTKDRGPGQKTTVKAISRPMMDVIDAMDTLNLYYPLLNLRRKRRKRSESFRSHETLIKRLWGAGITVGSAEARRQGAGRYRVRHSLIEGYAITGLPETLLQEVLGILNWIDPPDRSELRRSTDGETKIPWAPLIGPIPLLSQDLRDEVEDVIDRLEEPETEEGNTFNNEPSYKRGRHARI